EDAEGREVPVRHLAAAGYERREGANQPDEAADQDRPAAVTGEVVLDLLEARLADPEPLAVLDQEAAPEPGTEHEADRVAREGAEPGDRQDHRQGDVPLTRDRPAEHHRELARSDQPDEGPGLEEGQRADQQVGPGPQALREVLDRLLEVEV